ncbi:MAG: heme-copper oxidase subunit III [Actinomycetota bacterium]
MAERAVALEGSRQRVTPLRFGTILFLASELMFFAGLFAAYFSLRAISDPWPPEAVELDLLLPSVATALLVLSSSTFVGAMHALERGDHGRMRRWIAATAVLGTVFLASQIYDWTRLDFAVDTDAYGTIFYSMTGFHALHVFAGLLLMGVLLGRAAQGAYATGDHSSAHAIGYYWHFVDVVWVGLFAVIYLIR